MPRDVQISGGIGAAPQSYEVPNATEIIPRAINATFNGTATATAWVPTVEIISDGGVVVARCPCSTTVIAGGSAECSFYPFSDEITTAATGTFAQTVATVATANTLRGYWRLGESAAPMLDTSGWSGGPTDLTTAGAGAAPTFHVPGALGGGQDDGAIQINGGIGTGQYLHNASGAVNTGINGGWSVMAWVNPSSSAANWVASVYNNAAFSAGVTNGWELAVSWFGGTAFAITRRIITDAVLQAAVAIPFGTWTFIVGTYDGANLRIYTNGLLQTTTADARADTFNPYSNVDIGVTFTDPTTVVGRFFGSLDEIAVWGTVLTLTQIQTLYAAAF